MAKNTVLMKPMRRMKRKPRKAKALAKSTLTR